MTLPCGCRTGWTRWLGMVICLELGWVRKFDRLHEEMKRCA